VLVGWEGSAHDEMMILADSMDILDGLKIYEGKLYLANAGYACRPGILPPFRSTRYHLNEFSTKFFLKMARNFSISETQDFE
jgi:hypothetical protein